MQQVIAVARRLLNIAFKTGLTPQRTMDDEQIREKTRRTWLETDSYYQGIKCNWVNYTSRIYHSNADILEMLQVPELYKKPLYDVLCNATITDNPKCPEGLYDLPVPTGKLTRFHYWHETIHMWCPTQIAKDCIFTILVCESRLYNLYKNEKTVLPPLMIELWFHILTFLRRDDLGY